MNTVQESNVRPLGIMAALPEEIAPLINEMRAAPDWRTVTLGRREYALGTLRGMPCVMTLARVGKVAAATTATALIHQFGVDAIIFTGVAGGVARQVRVGDIVIADALMQHDLDASPLFPRFEVPLLGVSRFGTDDSLSDALTVAAASFVRVHAMELVQRYRGVIDDVPRVHRGLVVSGDRFIADHAAREAVLAAAPDALAVEMEGAALAQVCHEYDVRCAVVRTISDAADAHAAVSFSTFLAEVASAYSAGVLQRFLAQPRGHQ
ncbi:5'-methylthioadenosine/adenosylhomocysteine nucleosidase (plasmid) [Mycetohabitans rhizoxinica]|uniref:5'-methylthioadenosine/adenosylhomocysteine nucleosidase n=1 Tax=Mycetohabitans rhizoxinica TaxID=412963 RepID=UPI0030D2AAA0